MSLACTYRSWWLSMNVSWNSVWKAEKKRWRTLLAHWHVRAQGCMERLLLWTFDPRHMQSFTETSFVSPDKSCSKAGRSNYTWRQRGLQGRWETWSSEWEKLSSYWKLTVRMCVDIDVNIHICAGLQFILHDFVDLSKSIGNVIHCNTLPSKNIMSEIYFKLYQFSFFTFHTGFVFFIFPSWLSISLVHTPNTLCAVSLLIN